MTTIEAIEPLPFIDGIVYGEGPRWHNGRLWFSDVLAGKVCSVGEAGDVAVEAEVAHASGLGWLPDGTLVVSTLFDAKVHHVDAQGQVAATFDLSDFAWTTNDLFVAPDGRAYVDLYQAIRDRHGGRDRPRRSWRRRAGRRDRARPPQRSRLSARRVDPRRQRDERVSAARVSRRTRRQPRRPKRVRRPRPERHPDGLCVDVEGGVWVGCYDTGEFLRVVAGGTVTHRVAIDGGWSIAPALGGADGRTLYMVIDDTTPRASSRASRRGGSCRRGSTCRVRDRPEI